MAYLGLVISHFGIVTYGPERAVRWNAYFNAQFVSAIQTDLRSFEGTECLN